MNTTVSPTPLLSAQQVAQARVLVVGDVMLDRYWYGAVDRISPEAPVPVVRITREEERCGGAANVAYNITSLGAQAELLTVVGDDEASRKLEQLLLTTHIKTHFTRDADLKTTVKLRVIGRQQQLIRLDFENTPKTELLNSQTSALHTLLPAIDAVIFSDYGKGALGQVSDMILQAHAAKKPIFIDPKGSNYDLYRHASVITPNRAELEQVIGRWSSEAQLHQRAQQLRNDLKLQALVLTRSEEGMTLFDDQGELHVPAQAQEVFDVTGAGDTVIATLATLVASGLSLRKAIPLANKAGGVVVGKFGTASVSYQELFA